MFDFGFSEMLVIAVVALIVVGPQRLPKVARTAGHLLGRLQRYVSDVKADVSREMQLDELKKLQQQVQEQARDLESSVRRQVDDVGAEMKEATSEIRHEIDSVVEPGAPPMNPDMTSLDNAASVSDVQVNPSQVEAENAEAGEKPEPGLDRAGANKPNPAGN